MGDPEEPAFFSNALHNLAPASFQAPVGKQKFAQTLLFPKCWRFPHAAGRVEISAASQKLSCTLYIIAGLACFAAPFRCGPRWCGLRWY